MRRLCVVVAALGLVAGACGDDGGGDVEGIEWHLESLAGTDVPAEAEATLTLSDGTASGSSGCNTFTGGYELSGESLTFSPLAGTLMACVDNAINELEAAYLAALGRTASYKVDGDQMELFDAGGGTLMKFSTTSS